MPATQFTLLPNGRQMRVHAPDRVREDHARYVAECERAASVIAALNMAMTGYSVGPFRTLIVFNHEDH